MPFGVVSVVGLGMSVLEWGPPLAREVHVLGFFLPIGLNGVLSVFLKQKCIRLMNKKLTVYQRNRYLFFFLKI